MPKRNQQTARKDGGDEYGDDRGGDCGDEGTQAYA
jgi:hypothetical protein